MKKGRKIIGIILTLVMVMQILPVFATETEVLTSSAGGSGINYLINDNFGDGDLSGWTLVKNNGQTGIPDDLITTEEIKDSEGNSTGNYALKYEVTGDTWFNTHITKALATPAAFETGTDVVIETRVKQNNGYTYDEAGNATQASSGRSFLKYNFVAEEDDAEHNFNWGTLVANNKGNLFGTNGWTKKSDATNGDYYAYVNEVSLGKATANDWYNVKVIIHGTTGGTGNTADYIITADDGTVIGKTTKSVDINFPENSKWVNGTTTWVDPEKEPVAWVEDVLNTVDFRQREANILYVDYVRVYEVKQVSVHANLVNGRYVQYDENIAVKLTAEEALSIPEGTAVLTKDGAVVEAAVSYNSETNILTIDPAENLTVGDIYSLTFNDNEFNTFTGTKTFELEAREARSYGAVVNDTFDDLTLGITDNASGWYLGDVTGNTEKGTLEIVDSTTDTNVTGATGKVLKFTGDTAGTDNNQYSYLTRKIGGGIEYSDGGKIILKTRIKHTTNTSRVYFVENMPATLNAATGALGGNLYDIFMLNKTNGIQAYNGLNSGGTGNVESAFVTGDLANKWLDIEVTIDGYNKLMTTKVTVENDANSPYTAANKSMQRSTAVLENNYGKGTTETGFDALERLGFFFRETDNVLYIDYIEVYEPYGDVKVSTDETYKSGEDIKVTFDVPSGDDSFLDAVKLYSGETEIADVTKSINDAKNVVTITPATSLTEGAYKIVVDTANVSKVYTITNTTATFYVTDTEYLMYDEFGDGDAEGWSEALNTTYGTVGTEKISADGEEDNYALTYTNTAHYSAAYAAVDITGADFEKGKVIAVKTRFKSEFPSGGRFVFMYDKEYASGAAAAGTLFRFDYSDDETDSFRLITNTTDWSVSGDTTTFANCSGEWFDAEIRFTDYDTAYLILECGDKKWEGNLILQENAEKTALDSLFIRTGDGAKAYVDYVKVYEYTTSNVRVNTIEGKTFEAGKPIEFKVIAEGGAEVSDTIINTVAVEKDGKAVTAAAVYENGILKVTPENAAEGDIYTVTFADNDYVKYVDSTKEFIVTARGERETGVIINDTFDDEYLESATEFGGWVKGESTVETKLAVDTTTFPGMSVLKLWTEDSAATPHETGKQAITYKKLGNGVEFNGENKVIIKTKVYQTTPTNAGLGRFDFKFNRPNSTTQLDINEGPWMQYCLFRQQNNTSKLVSGFGNDANGENYVNDAPIANLAPENQWVEYTITLDGKAKTMDVVAVTENGTYPASGLFSLAPAIYEDLYGAGVADEDCYVKALESLTFRNPVAQPVYIDYITVYEEGSTVKANVSETVKYDKPLKIKLDTDIAIDELDASVAEVTDVETDFAYDAEAKTITLTPASDLIEGTSYTVTINKSVLEAKGLIYEGATSFTVKARGNIIFDNQFKTAGDLEGWIIGETTVSEDKYSYGVVDDAMYLTINEGRDDPDTPSLYLDFDDVEYEEGQKIVIETKVKQTGGESNHRSFLKLNRPNKSTFTVLNKDDGSENGANWYSLFVLRGNQFDATHNSDHSITSTMFKPSELGLSNLSNVWVDVTIELDGFNNVAYITATPEGSTKQYTAISTLVDCESALANAGAPETGHTAFGSLTWLFRSAAGANTLYVDYIKAYEKVDTYVTIDAAAMPGYDVKIKGNADIGAYIKTGTDVLDNITDLVDLYNGEDIVDATKTHIEGTQKVVIDPTNDLNAGTYTVKFDTEALAAAGYVIEGESEFEVNVIEGADVDMDFEGLTAGKFEDSTWAFDESTVTGTANIVTEDNNNFLRITANGETSVDAGKVLTYSKTLATPFVRDMKASTVFEMKIRTNSLNVRKLVKFNNPDDGDINTNAYNEVGWNTRTVAVMNKGNLGIAYKDYRDQGDGSNQKQGNAETVATYEADQWYTIKTVYYNAEGTASSYVYDQSGKLIGLFEDKALTAWWFNFYDYSETQPQVMHSINDITIRFRPEGAIIAENEQFDIDDIKLYNITEVDESATVKFVDSVDATKEITSITADGSVVPTFEIQSKNNAATKYYIIAAKYDNGKLVGSPQMEEVTVSGKQTITLDAIEVDKDNTGLVVKAFVWNENMAPVCKAAEIKPTVYTIYMATNGNDANEGYESTPVATLDKAIELANDAHTNGYSTAEVIVADGNYELTGNQITIGSNLKADSLTVRAENEGGAKFINGVTYKLSDAKKVTDTNITSKLVEESARNNLYVLDLTTKVDIDDIPKVNLPGTYSYAADGLTMKDNTTLEITESRDGTCEMFFGGMPMTVARYPDVTADSDGYERLEEGNFYYNTNSVTRYWMSDKQNTDDYIAVENRVADPFTVTLDRAKNWTDANQALAFGYWNWDWATQTVPVAAFSADGVITSTYPSHYGLKAGQRYYVYNLLEEISQPGEYFIDRTTGLMYFMLPVGADITNEEQEITMSLYGDKDNGIINITASNVIIDGLVFTASRGRAVKAYGNNVVIKNCEISGTAGFAASLSGTNSVIEYCNIHDVDGGISLGGGNLSTLKPGNNKVLNNTITNFSRLSKTYTDAIDVSGVGNKASHNNISGGEHLAITLSGVDNEISYNDISYVLQETDDAGAIYTGRTWIDRDNVIKYNYFHDMGNSKHTTGEGKSPVAAIFLDDHFADITIYGNIFNNILGHGVRGNGGRDITISNNIFEKCSEGAAHFTDASGNAADYMTHIQGNDGNGGVEQYYGNAAWIAKYPELFSDENGTAYNPELLKTANLVYTNNFAVEMSSGGSFGTVGAASGAKEPNTTLISSNPFNGNYTNHLTIIKNHETYPLSTFEEIPVGQIGTSGTEGRTE